MFEDWAGEERRGNQRKGKERKRKEKRKFLPLPPILSPLSHVTQLLLLRSAEIVIRSFTRRSPKRRMFALRFSALHHHINEKIFDASVVFGSGCLVPMMMGIK